MIRALSCGVLIVPPETLNKTVSAPIETRFCRLIVPPELVTMLDGSVARDRRKLRDVQQAARTAGLKCIVVSLGHLRDARQYDLRPAGGEQAEVCAGDDLA